MTTRTDRWPAGVPCWVDLTTPDVAAAQRFYSDVLGWEFPQPPSEEFGGYTIAHVRDFPAAGIGPLQPGAPSAWTMYIASDDADATANAVTASGGVVLLPPGDVGTFGRMLLAADPSGAVFGVWQAMSHIGAGLYNEPGGLTWEDLRSTDPDAARAFYAAVFGYQTSGLPGAGADYTTFEFSPERPLGGMGGMMSGEGSSSWLVYFAVRDASAAVVAAEAGGGSVLTRGFDTPFGRMAGLADPAGAPFWVAQAPSQGQ